MSTLEQVRNYKSLYDESKDNGFHLKILTLLDEAVENGEPIADKLHAISLEFHAIIDNPDGIHATTYNDILSRLEIVDEANLETAMQISSKEPNIVLCCRKCKNTDLKNSDFYKGNKGICKKCHNSSRNLYKRNYTHRVTGFMKLDSEIQQNISKELTDGISIRKVSIKYNIPYSNLYRWHNNHQIPACFTLKPKNNSVQ